jgi:UDP-N-acetylglucosamine 2-epimerase (non-hydrolysing)
VGKPVVVLVGTRPEALKLILLHKRLLAERVRSVLCSTQQHSDLLNQVFTLFDIQPDISLDVMTFNQDLFGITTSVLSKIKDVLIKLNPRLLIVQGDTTSAFAAALSAFYLKIPVAHVEAGLRSGDINSPYPEEFNRVMISKIANYHFAPTPLNCANLLREGVSRDKIFCTGNTIVDTLFLIKNKILSGQVEINKNLVEKIDKCRKSNQKIVLFTAHRRESFGVGLLKIFNCIRNFALNNQSVRIFYVKHPNPNVIESFEKSGLGDVENVDVFKPLNYIELVYLLLNASLVVTDSGGIQEEAMSLGKRVLILRDVTERIEGLWEGLGRLVGTDENLIYEGLKAFSSNEVKDEKKEIFGDGGSVERIIQILKIKVYPDISEKRIDKIGQFYGEEI